MERISGMNFDITLGTEPVHVKSATLDISDNTTVATTRGVPDGWTSGDVAAEGEFELDVRNFKKVNERARAAGGWRAMATTDILFYAETGTESIKIEAFGCKLILTSLFGADPNGGETATKKVKYIVTAPEFIRIDGVPVLSEADVRGILG